MQVLNLFFDKIYVINLDRRPERWAEALREMEKWQIYAERFSAVDGQTLANQGYTLSLGAVGLIKTNLNILQEAKAKGYKQILILEDDIFFTYEIVNFLQYYNLVPDDWKMLYFSGNHNGHVLGVMPPAIVNDRVLRIHETYSTHAVAIKAEFFDTIIETIAPCQHPLDVYYAQLQKKHSVYCFKNYNGLPMAGQRVGYSDITESNADYSWLIK